MVGRDKINYSDDCGAQSADMVLVKMLFNSIVSTLVEKFMCINIKNFYINTPLKWYQYLCNKLADILEEIIRNSNLHNKVMKDGYI